MNIFMKCANVRKNICCLRKRNLTGQAPAAAWIAHRCSKLTHLEMFAHLIPFIVGSAYAVTVLTPQANYIQSLDCEVYSKYPVPASSRMHLNLCFNSSKAIGVGFTRSDTELGDAAKNSFGTTWNVQCRAPTASEDAFVYIPSLVESGIPCTRLTYPPLNQACFEQDAAVYISISKKWDKQPENYGSISVIIDGIDTDSCALAQNQFTSIGNSAASVTFKSATQSSHASQTSSVKPTCGYPAKPAAPAPQAGACQSPIPPAVPAVPDALYGGGGGGGGGGRQSTSNCPGVPAAPSAPGAPPSAGHTVCDDASIAGEDGDIVAEATKSSTATLATSRLSSIVSPSGIPSVPSSAAKHFCGLLALIVLIM
jgi:hypothetical protein